MRDHGGNLDAAIRDFGGTRARWIDLSTGINPRPYPLPEIPPHAWAALPTDAESATLIDAAAAAYDSAEPPLPLAGAQAAIQLVPSLRPPSNARVLAPTYNEHTAALRAQGWQVSPAAALTEMTGADLAVVVNPNNPDGRRFDPAELRALATTVGILVVDESFADPYPELSLAGSVAGNIVVLRSFGKFYGLAGLRLGFAIAAPELRERLATRAGPWAVSGPAIAIGRAALADDDWQAATIERLSDDAARLDRLAARGGWRAAGGSTLFRLYETGDALTARSRLARAHIWSRAFPYSPGWLRLGLPDGPEQWERVAAALGG